MLSAQLSLTWLHTSMSQHSTLDTAKCNSALHRCPCPGGLCRCRFICNTFASKDQQTPGALSGLAFGQLGFGLHICTSLGNKAWLPCGNRSLHPLREGSPGFIHRERREGPSVFWKLALGSLLPWETLGCWVSGELFLLMVASSGG